MTTDTTRRSFIGGLLALSTGAAGVASTSSQPVCDDVAKLVHWYGEDAVLQHLQRLLDAGEDVTFRSLRRSLNNERRRENRYAASRKRREDHRDTVLYRGPAYLSDQIWHLIAGLRPVTSGVNRRTLLVGTSPYVLHVKYHAIPTGTRLLVDGRRELDGVVMVEYVQCETDRTPYRLHIYAANGGGDGRVPPTLDVGQPTEREDIDHLYQIQESME